MEELDKREGALGCFVFVSRTLAIMAALAGLIKGFFTGNPMMMVGAPIIAGLSYLLVWLGAKLVMKGMKKAKRSDT
ncbi:TPA: hypothetical protein DCX15_06195 [bacterium]|nr:hypothetical protein [bacterium]